MAMNNYMQYGIYPEVGTKMWCPVCGKYFKATDDTRYIRWGYYVCNWKCFLTKTDSPIEEPTDGVASELVGKSVEKKQPKVTKSATSASNRLPKSANIASNKQVKSENVAEKPTEKCNISSQKTPKKCDKVELF
jgi:hypothetical protein